MNNYQGHDRIITMVGTSFLTNYNRNNEDPCYRELSKFIKLIGKKEDNIKYYLLCRSCVNRKLVTGKEKTAAIDKTGPIII